MDEKCQKLEITTHAWIFQYFSGNKILRENNFGDWRSKKKTADFAVSEAVQFDF